MLTRLANIQLELMEKHLNKLVKTAIWAPDIGVNYTSTSEETAVRSQEKLQVCFANGNCLSENWSQLTPLGFLKS